MDDLVRSNEIPGRILPILCGIALGVAVYFSGNAIVVVAIIAAFFLALIFKNPEIGILGLLAVYSTFLSANSDPHISIGFGNLYLTDLLLLSLFGLVFARALLVSGFRLNRTPLDIPYIGFYGLAVVSTLMAVLYSNLSVKQSLGEVRIVNGYLTFFLVTNLVRRDQQIRNLMKGFLLISTLVAVVMIAQSLLGISTRLFAGRIEALATGDTLYTGITRVLPPGQSLILSGFILLCATWVVGGPRSRGLSLALQCGLLGLTLVLTFNRSFWVGSALSLLLMTLVVGHRGRKRLALGALFTVLVVALLLIAALTNPDTKIMRYVDAAMDRFGTLLRPDTVREESLQNRYLETQYALPQILPPSLIGIGLGATYRDWDPKIDWQVQGAGFDGRGYLHNAHLWLLLKSGLLSYLCFLLLFGMAISRGFRYWSSIEDAGLRAVALGITLTLLSVLIGSIVNPMLMQRYWTPLLGILLGTNEALIGKSVSKAGEQAMLGPSGRRKCDQLARENLSTESPPAIYNGPRDT